MRAACSCASARSPQVGEQADVRAAVMNEDLLRRAAGIQQAQIHPLPRQRVDGVGRIPHQHQALAGKVA
jgi:hypothetical protein